MSHFLFLLVSGLAAACLWLFLDFSVYLFTPCGRRIDGSGHSIKDALSTNAFTNRYNLIGQEEKRQILKKNENSGTNSIFRQKSDPVWTADDGLVDL